MAQKKIEMPLTVFYTINNDYRSDSSYPPESLTILLNYGFFLAYVLVVVAIVVFFASIIGWIDRKTRKRKNA